VRVMANPQLLSLSTHVFASLCLYSSTSMISTGASDMKSCTKALRVHPVADGCSKGLLFLRGGNGASCLCLKRCSSSSSNVASRSVKDRVKQGREAPSMVVVAAVRGGGDVLVK
jgi:hypothetical protein